MIKKVTNRITNMEVYRWTVSAKFCYDRGCVCKNCYYKENLETVCKMKSAVLELVRRFGKPPQFIISSNNGNTYYPKT